MLDLLLALKAATWSSSDKSKEPTPKKPLCTSPNFLMSSTTFFAKLAGTAKP
jgi:hypothetical protein